jgi:hypothetical protein
MSLEECTSRASLLIALKSQSARSFAEGGGGTDDPGGEFGSVGHFACVVVLETLVQVSGVAGVELVGMGEGLKDVDVVVGVHCAV